MPDPRASRADSRTLPLLGPDPKARTRVTTGLLVGLDENGMGPRLGPLLCTAVSVRASSRYRSGRAIAKAREVGIDDSKATSAHGKMAAAEGIALAVVEATTGSVPSDVDALLAAIELDGPDRLQHRCPGTTRAQCWSAPVALPRFASEEDLGRGREAIRALRSLGLELLRVRCVYHCASLINAAKESGVNKLVLDLRAFERLSEDAWLTHGERREGRFVCGMIGGLRRYVPHMRLSHRFPVLTCDEQRDASTYWLDGFGEMRFEIDADASHVPVALASIVGKLVRELAVERQNAFYGEHVADLPAASGYHDPITARFVDATARVRKKLRIASACFER